MSSSEVLKLNEQVIDTWNKHDTTRFIELCDDSVVWTINKGPETYKGKSQIKDYFNNWKTAFPDLSLKLRNTLASGDLVATEYVFTGTHKGELVTRADMPNISPTQKKIETSGCYFARIKNGKVVELNNYPDRLGLLDQLGVLTEMHQHEGM